MEVFVVNMIPEVFSGENWDDFEPNVAVCLAQPSFIAASAMTLDPDPQAIHRPIYYSTDGGSSWSLSSIVPASVGQDPAGTTDITLRFASMSNRLYVSFLDPHDYSLRVARTADLTFMSEMELIGEALVGADQPYIQAATVLAGPDAGKDRIYVGFNYNQTASMHYSLDAAASQPSFATVALEARGSTGGVYYNLPQIRTAVHPHGYVYAVFYNVMAPGTSVDVVVVRDDHWGTAALPFTSLKDTDDLKPGQRVVKGVVVGPTGFEAEGFEGGGELSIAVHPNDPSAVYIAWADTQPATGYTLHVRRSLASSPTDWGQHWTGDLVTIPNALNPALAINSEGVVGFLFQQYVQRRGAEPRWETHFQHSADDAIWEDLLIATIPPYTANGARLGDYVHLMTVDRDFYGVFCGANTPDPAHFPSTPNLDSAHNEIVYQRRHDFGSKKLFSLDGNTEVPISIDPFFFKVTGIERARYLFKVPDVAIDPLALLLPSDIYGRLVEKFHPHEIKVTDIHDAARGMSAEARAAVVARARLFGARAKAIEEALTREI